MIKGEVIPFHGEIVDRDAIDIGELYAKAKASLVDSVRYQFECGQRLAAKKDSLSHGEWYQWLEANEPILGFRGKNTATRLMKMASNRPLTDDLDEAEAAKISRETWGNAGGGVRGTFGTGENEWYTPPEYIEKAKAVLGEIDLDPASSEAAQAVVGAAAFFGKEADGLANEWHGRIWLNPPYAQPLIADFMAKLVDEYWAGHIQEALALTHNYTDTSWFQDTAKAASAICLTRGRIRFVSPDGTLAAPTQGQAFFYFGNNVSKFIEAFCDVGIILGRFK